MSLLTRFLVFAAGAACLPSASYAEPRNGPRLEEPACHPLTTANEALAKIPIFQATWDAVIKRDTGVVVMHRDAVYANGMLYERTAPYAPWRGKAHQLGNPRHSGCHQLREEVLDGVNTVVISYWRHNPTSIRDGIAARSGLKFQNTGTESWAARPSISPRRQS
ncbi:hypothetical protein NKI01_07445 [Mesorhizobium sp. M0815]|uniref:hypothetical protein n=1 Tax=Mesorhizobium sp. M0815 TaxID=2957005 RepID=UPI003339A014